MERITLSALKKRFTLGSNEVQALRGVSFSVNDGDFVALMGKSGSGKSTLMNIIGCLDGPSSGHYFLDGERVDTLEGSALADIRNQKIGFVFQKFNLLPRMSALDNVALPLLYDRSYRVKDPMARAAELLTRVGLGDRLDHEPSQLSGGQQQRVAIARALVNHPSILLADEPTGNLDSRTTLEVMALFQSLHAQGITIVLVTHESDVAQYATRKVELRDGRIVGDIQVQDRRDAAEEIRQGLYQENEPVKEDSR